MMADNRSLPGGASGGSALDDGATDEAAAGTVDEVEGAMVADEVADEYVVA